MKSIKFWKTTFSIAIPVAIQGLLYSLLNILDQIMVSQKGQIAVVSINLASKNFGVLNFTLMGLTGGLAILVAQLIGSNQKEKIAKIQGLTIFIGTILTILFIAISIVLPKWSMQLFTEDISVIKEGISYHRTLALGYFPVLLTMIYSTILRNDKIVKLPMIIGIITIFINALLNYLLIFGKCGFPELGVMGSGLATSMAQIIEALILTTIIYRKKLIGAYSFKKMWEFTKFDSDIKFFLLLTFPLLIEEISFILSDSVSNAIYGFMGTQQMLVISIMSPIQSLILSFFSGFSTSASVLIGNYLGSGKKEKAYNSAKNILIMGATLPLMIGSLLLLFNNWYLGFYDLNNHSFKVAQILMVTMVIILPVKILNMIITQGVLNAGGETKFVLYQSILGSWLFAVPLGFLSAFVFHLSIYWVFIIISFEEFVRLLLCIKKMKTRTWMKNLTL